MASISKAGLIALTLTATCGTAFAQQGTDAQRDACTPDAFRLCTSAMPDAGRVESCLRAAGPRLSAACYDVFYPPDQQTQTNAQGRGREQRETRRRQDQRYDTQREDGPRTDRPRDDGFGGFERREFQSRPPQQNDDD